MNTWEMIMEKSPTMKRLVEEKITSEIASKQAEIEQLKQENTALQIAIAELAEQQVTEITNLQLAIAELAEGGEM